MSGGGLCAVRGFEQIGWQLAPEPAFLGALHYGRSHAGELHAQSVVFENGDFAVVLAARHVAAHQLADLPDAVPGHGAARDSFGEPDRLVVFDLVARADHDSRGAPEAFVVEIAPAQHLVAVDDGADEGSRLEPATVEHRLVGIGRHDYDIRAGDGIVAARPPAPPGSRAFRPCGGRMLRGWLAWGCRL